MNQSPKLASLAEEDKIELVKEIARTNFRLVSDRTGYSRGSLNDLVQKFREVYEQFRTKLPPARTRAENSMPREVKEVLKPQAPEVIDTSAVPSNGETDQKEKTVTPKPAPQSNGKRPTARANGANGHSNGHNGEELNETTRRNLKDLSARATADEFTYQHQTALIDQARHRKNSADYLASQPWAAPPTLTEELPKHIPHEKTVFTPATRYSYQWMFNLSPKRSKTTRFLEVGTTIEIPDKPNAKWVVLSWLDDRDDGNGMLNITVCLENYFANLHQMWSTTGGITGYDFRRLPPEAYKGTILEPYKSKHEDPKIAAAITAEVEALRDQWRYAHEIVRPRTDILLGYFLIPVNMLADANTNFIVKQAIA